jgi:hypothetical protein
MKTKLSSFKEELILFLNQIRKNITSLNRKCRFFIFSRRVDFYEAIESGENASSLELICSLDGGKAAIREVCGTVPGLRLRLHPGYGRVLLSGLN